MVRKIVLLADNDEEYVETRSNFLQRRNITVFTAHSPSEARKVLDNEWIHVALLDIRLEDDNDPQDVSGINLAKEEKYKNIPKIIVTYYPSWEYARVVLGPKIDGLPHAVDFLAKKEGLESLVTAIEAAMQKWVQLNYDLEFDFSEHGLMGFDGFIRKWEPNLTPKQQFNRTQELEDLFRRLFNQERILTLDTMLWQRTGQIALTTFTQGSGSMRSQFIVTFGTNSQMQPKESTFSAVKSRIGNVHLVSEASTKHFTAKRHQLNGVNLERVQTLKNSFPVASKHEIRTILGNLFERNMNGEAYGTNWLPESKKSWLDIAIQWLDLPDLDELVKEIKKSCYAVDRQAREYSICGIEIEEDELIFQLPNGLDFITMNPLPLLDMSGRIVPTKALVSGTTFSALDVDTILVDDKKNTHLTDFGSISDGPLLGEFAALETSLKFDLDEHVSLVDFREMELILSQVDRLDRIIDSGPRSLDKVMSAIQHLRKQATGEDGYQDDFEPYGWLLFFLAAKRILNYQPQNRGRLQRELIPVLCACISMGLVAERLIEIHLSEDITPPPTGLEFNEDVKKFSVDGRPVTLAPTEQKLLTYLWEHAEKLCLRKDIYEAVYSEPYDPDFLDDSCNKKLNTAVNRARRKIEPDTSNPIYLQTSYGQGFILYPNGKGFN